MSDTNEITIAVIGRVHAGKTAVIGVINEALKAQGFDVTIQQLGEEALHDEVNQPKIVQEIAGKTLVRVIETARIASGRLLPATPLPEVAADAPVVGQQAQAADLVPGLSLARVSKIIPFWRENTASAFIDTEGRTLQVTTLGDDITGLKTLPLKFNQRVSLLQLGTAEELLARGDQDPTDSIHPPSVWITSLVFRTREGQYVALPIRGSNIGADLHFKRPGPKFGRGNPHEMVLWTNIFQARLSLDENTVDIFGEPLNPAMGRTTLTFAVQMTGSVYPQSGDLEVKLANCALNSIMSTHDDLTEPKYHDFMTLEGFTVHAERTNMNRVRIAR